MKIETVYEELKKSKLEVEDSKKFFSALSSYDGGAIGLLADLKKMEDLAKGSVDYVLFEDKIIECLHSISVYINKDSVYTLSNKEDIDNFKMYYNNIINNYIFINRLEDENKLCLKLTNEMEKIGNQIKSTSDAYDLSKLHLQYQRLHAQLISSNEKREKFNKMIKVNSNKANFTSLLDGAVRDFSMLASGLKNLTLTKETKAKINDVLINMSNQLKNEKESSKNDIVNYLKLLDYVGLQKNINYSYDDIELPKVKNEDTIINEVKENKEEVKEVDTSIKIGENVYYTGINYDNVSLEYNKPYKVIDAKLDDNGNEVYKLDGIEEDVSVISLEPEYLVDKQELSLKRGEKVFTSGIRKYNKDDVKLEMGKEYTINKGMLDEKGNEIYYLDGIDKPVSVMNLVNENRWNEYMESMVNQRVVLKEEPKKNIDKKDMYLNSVINLSKKPKLSSTIKKAFSSVLNGVKNKFKEIKDDLLLTEYDDLIDREEFAKEFEEIKARRK